MKINIYFALCRRASNGKYKKKRKMELRKKKKVMPKIASNKSGSEKTSHSIALIQRDVGRLTTALAITRPFSVFVSHLRARSVSVTLPLRSTLIGSHDCKVPSHKRPTENIHSLRILPIHHSQPEPVCCVRRIAAIAVCATEIDTCAAMSASVCE